MKQLKLFLSSILILLIIFQAQSQTLSPEKLPEQVRGKQFSGFVSFVDSKTQQEVKKTLKLSFLKKTSLHKLVTGFMNKNKGKVAGSWEYVIDKDNASKGKFETSYSDSDNTRLEVKLIDEKGQVSLRLKFSLENIPKKKEIVCIEANGQIPYSSKPFPVKGIREILLAEQT